MHLLEYSRVALVSSTDAYGVEGANAFSAAAASAGLSLSLMVAFRKDSTEFDSHFREVLRSQSRVIVLFCQASDGVHFVRSGLNHSVGGAGF
eukprot:2741852-Prymnesium_polylepis.1